MTEQRIKVLFWPGWWYPSRVDPLSGLFIQRHAEAVATRCDVSVLYVVADRTRKELKPAVTLCDERGLTVTRVFYRPPRWGGTVGKLVDLLRFARAANAGLAVLAAHWDKPDLVNVHVNPPAGLVWILFTRLRRLPFVLTEHWSGYQAADGTYRGFLRTRLTRLVVKRARAVTTVSDHLAETMRRHGLAARYEVIPNVVDTDLFKPSSPEPGAASTKRLLHVGRLHREKNTAGLLEVVARLTAERDDFELLVVGDGPQRDELVSSAERLGLLQHTVRFVGNQPPDEVARLMGSAHGVVLFSDFENSPCVIGEALACGVPVVATAVGGIPELVDRGSGVLVPAGDQPALATALHHLLDHRDDYDPAALRAQAERRLSRTAVAGRFEQLYLSVLEDPARGRR